MSSDIKFNQFTGTDGYVVSGPLVDAVNCSIALERPLLIKGEPGTGKTLLARHVAQGLGLPMESWHIKSTSKTSDGLYVYDTVQRLNDARFGDGDVNDIRKYIKLFEEMPEVLEASRVTGEHCFIVRCAIAEPSDLERVVDSLAAHGSVKTSLVLSNPVNKATTIRTVKMPGR